MVKEVLLKVEGITKRFPGVLALDKVNFELCKGEVHAIVGENGAGKSTLMNILAGVFQADEGKIFLSGRALKVENPYMAIINGVSTVYQELSLADSLSIAENIITYQKPLKKFGFIDWPIMYKRCEELLKLFDKKELKPRTLVKELSLAEKQVVEILKAISSEPRILILDEPTSSLSQVEVDKLFSLIRQFKEKGTSVIYISHHLREIFEIADRVTVFRDGRNICTNNIAEVKEQQLVTKMVGREIMAFDRNTNTISSQEYFIVDNISSKKMKDITFHVRKGEILSIYGLVGAGRTELAKAIFGLDPIKEGHMFLNGKEIKVKNPAMAVKNRIAYVSEDRKESGLYLEKTIQDNVVSSKLYSYQKIGWMDDGKIKKTAEKYIDLTKIKCFSAKQLAATLSGGNQQKLLLAAWFQIDPLILIVDEPTRGVDIGARSEIYNLIRDMAQEGRGVIIITSDLPESLILSDRIIVMKDRRIVTEFLRDEATEEKIIASATGVAI